MPWHLRAGTLHAMPIAGAAGKQLSRTPTIDPARIAYGRIESLQSYRMVILPYQSLTAAAAPWISSACRFPVWGMAM